MDAAQHPVGGYQRGYQAFGCARGGSARAHHGRPFRGDMPPNPH